MQRVLEPAQIESLAQRQIARVRLPEAPRLFAARGERLAALSQGHPLEAYLALMALLCEAQQRALDARVHAPADARVDVRAGPGLPEELLPAVRRAVQHGMPPLPAVGLPRTPLWREILAELCAAVAGAPGFPAQVAATVERLAAAPPEVLEGQADVLLAADSEGVDAQAAPFVMAALQVRWTLRVLQLPVEVLTRLPDVGTVCPLCGSLPVASVVRSDKEYEGLRYLACGLCASQWHMVRVKCSHCESTAGIHYQSIEDGPKGIRAEACEQCHTYRKIFYHEHEPAAEAVADDLASLALDLLASEAGYHRASGNPLLWQPSTGR